MRLLYESTENISSRMVTGYLEGGHYRDVFLKEIQEKKLNLQEIISFLRNFKNEKIRKKKVSKEELLDKLLLLKAEKRKIFFKIAKNQNKRSIIPIQPVESDKKVYLSKKKS